MDEIGFGLIEMLTLATVACGVLWLLAWRWRRQLAERPRKPLWVTWGAELFGVLALVVGGKVALADWTNVPTGSMEPTVRIGDYLLVNKLAYGPRLPFTNTALELGEPQRGDVVVFRYPLDVSILYVKRLVGLPGDVVDYDRGVLRLNGEPWEAQANPADMSPEPEDRGQFFVRETAGGQTRTIKLDSSFPGAAVPPQAWLRAGPDVCQVQHATRWRCTVPAGKYLMMGDNRDNSADSRVFSFVDHREIYGKAVRVVINFHRMDRFWHAL